MVNLKASRFNFFANLDNNVYLLFNGMSGALYEITGKEKEMVNILFSKPGTDTISPVFRNLLKEGGFLIPKGTDEISILKKRAHNEAIHSPILDLFIIPTYACNFRCTYCYVEFKNGKMRPWVERAIVKHIEHTICNYAQININWFGGEPLLFPDVIIRVSSEITKIANRHDVKLINLLSTNGYLLNSRCVENLRKAGVNFFHVTIDGAKEYHNKFRVLVNAKSTYDRIMANVLNLLDSVPDAQLTLRMNVNENNITSFRKVIDEIPSQYRSRITFRLNPIILKNQKPTSALYRQIIQCQRITLNEGFQYSSFYMQLHRRNYCIADKNTTFQVAPDGTLYKCSPHKDKKEIFIGHLNKNGGIVLDTDHNERWNNTPVFGKKCLYCPYLCFCMGGCHIDRLRGSEDISCRDCYANMKDRIINLYLAIKSGAIHG